MNQANKILYIVLSVVLILYTSLLTLVADNDGNSFLDYVRIEYFIIAQLLGFIFWLGYEYQLENKSYSFASCVILIGLPVFSIQTIRNISYSNLHSLPFDIDSSVMPMIIILFIFLFFPLKNLFIREISLNIKLLPLIVLLVNIVFFTFLLNQNFRYNSGINYLKSVTRKTELKSLVSSVKLIDPPTFSYCEVTAFITEKGEKIYGIYTSVMQSAEYFADLEEGDSIIKVSGSYDGTVIKKNGEKFEVTFVPTSN